MTPVHVISVPAPSSAPPRLAPRSAPRSAALPSLRRAGAPSLTSGVILALVLLAILLQASFLVGLATGGLAAPQPAAAVRTAALAR